MSTYWKQSLWIGGIYWVVSLAFYYAGTYAASLTDVAFSLLLLPFLIAMKWLSPIKGVEKAMKKAPVTATLLVSIGWVPYFVGGLIVVSSLYALVLMVTGNLSDYTVFSLYNFLFIVEAVRQLVMILAVLAAVFMIVIWKKSVVGCLGKNYKLSGDDVCDMPTLDAAAAQSAKNMYACKEKAKEAGAETVEVKIVKKTALPVKKKTVKKAVKDDKAKTGKKTAAAAKNPVKKTAGSSVKKAAGKKAPAKKTADKK